MIRNVFPVFNHVSPDIQSVSPDIQSVFPDFQSEFLARKSLSLRENGKSLATLQRPRNMLSVTDVTVASARNLLPHLPRFSRPAPVRFPVPFPCPMQHSIPLLSNRPRGCGKCCKRIAGSCHRNSCDFQWTRRWRCKVARVFPNCLYGTYKAPLLIY